jgi:hypothetical protein
MLSIFCAWRRASSACRPSGDLDRFGHDGHDQVLPVADGAHLEIKPSPAANREVYANLLAHDLAACHDGDRIAHRFGHARCAREPGRVPERLADHVFQRASDTSK